MTAGREASKEPENRAGYCRLRRGLPEKDPRTKSPTTETQWNYERLIRRAGASGAWLIVYIIDRTISAYHGDNVPPPAYAELKLASLAVFLNMSSRQVRNLLKFLAAPERRLISQHPNEPWLYQAHPENFENAPVLRPVKRPRKPRIATVTTQAGIAALRGCSHPSGRDVGATRPELSEIHFPPCEEPLESQRSSGSPRLESEAHLAAPEARADGSEDLTRQGETVAESITELRPQRYVKPISETVQFKSEDGKTEVHAADMDFQNPDAHCPLGLGCPFMASALESDKPISLITINSKPAGQPTEDGDWPTESDTDQIKVMLTESEVSSLFQNQIPGSILLREIWTNLQGAPLDSLKQRIWHRHKHGYTFESMGLVRDLAREVGDRWQIDQNKAWRQHEQGRIQRFSAVRERVYEYRELLHYSWLELQALSSS